MNKFDTLFNQILSEAVQYTTTIDEFPVGKILIGKGVGTFKKIDKLQFCETNLIIYGLFNVYIEFFSRIALYG